MERLNISVLVGRTSVRFRVKPTMQAMRMQLHLLEHLGLGGQTDMIRILHDGTRMRDDTLSAQGVQDGDELDCMFETVGSVHSGLYLDSPSDIPQLTMKLVLAPGIVSDSVWLPGFHSYDDHRFIDWAGSLLIDSNDWQWGRRSLLQERETGERGGFLQWNMRFEDELNDSHDGAMTPGARCGLSDENAVVLRYNEVAPYIQDALNNFISEYEHSRSFFLCYSNLVRRPYVAIRFLEQAVYESVAPLSISPPPDIVTRIVLLFRGVEESELDEWLAARERYQPGPSYWESIVSVDKRAMDQSLYHAFEWKAVEL